MRPPDGTPETAAAANMRVPVVWMAALLILVVGLVTYVAWRSRSRTQQTMDSLRRAACEPRAAVMRTVKGGVLLTARPATQEVGARPDADVRMEAPAPDRVVRIDTFELDATEVTEAAYDECVRASVCTVPVARGDSGTMDRERPVFGVAPEQAVRYCHWLGKRLPTENEWEYAFRGSTERVFPWGFAEPVRGLACWSLEQPCKVAAFVGDRSESGVYDMAGSVREWTCEQRDCTGERWVVRGGSYLSRDRRELTGWARRVAHTAQDDLGFRCAR